MNTKRKTGTASRPTPNSRPETADLARGANGLGEDTDVDEIARGILTAQMRVMNTMMQTSADMTATGLRAMTQFWTMGLPGKRSDSKERFK
ncbi:hypothetical protein [Thalassococcus lentus]|uniref:Uncharacterized protein n=1 Tax=Thalassococcus lentus TaxID=1210524 RepID=A0ABT4XV56_9RHOB|nr:hypothetical protein [Thalassococcus lentus]MDA7425808.1 hypothetical protein [Thalassococcus lentus]